MLEDGTRLSLSWRGAKTRTKEQDSYTTGVSALGSSLEPRWGAGGGNDDSVINFYCRSWKLEE